MLLQLFRALVVLLVAVSAASADPPAESKVAADPDLTTAQARIKAKDWASAADVMQKAVARDPKNADYHNLLAYAIRNGANPDMDLVFRHYQEALRLDPKHRGAHEYIGEAYLMTGNVTKAKEHLAALDRLCLFGCPEYRDLKKAIERHEAGKKR